MDLMKTITEQFPPWFVNTKTGQAAVAEKLQQEFATRQGVFDEHGRFLGDLRAMVAEHAAAEKPLNEAVAALRAKLAVAEGKQQIALRKHAKDLHQLKAQIERCERGLRESASLEIDQASRAITERFERGRHDLFRAAVVTTGKINPETRRSETQAVNNEPAIRRLLEAMRSARDAFEALKLENPHDVAAAIKAINAPVEAAWQAASEFETAA